MNSQVSRREAWDFATSFSSLDGVEPSDELKSLIELHVAHEISMEEIRARLKLHYSRKAEVNNA
jgi:hypothetical protein